MGSRETLGGRVLKLGFSVLGSRELVLRVGGLSGC